MNELTVKCVICIKGKGRLRKRRNITGDITEGGLLLPPENRLWGQTTVFTVALVL